MGCVAVTLIVIFIVPAVPVRKRNESAPLVWDAPAAVNVDPPAVNIAEANAVNVDPPAANIAEANV